MQLTDWGPYTHQPTPVKQYTSLNISIKANLLIIKQQRLPNQLGIPLFVCQQNMIPEMCRNFSMRIMDNFLYCWNEKDNTMNNHKTNSGRFYIFQ